MYDAELMQSQELAALAGTALATFGATWATVMRQVKSKTVSSETHQATSKDLAALRTEIQNLSKKQVEFEEFRKNSKERQDEIVRKLGDIEREMRRTVTDEEFGVYTKQTTQAINGFAERVARITGFLDASKA